MPVSRPSGNSRVVVRAKDDANGRPNAKDTDLPPLPRCKEHPRRELELYCKLCQTVMCPTCKETAHSQCQNTWAEKLAQDGLAQGIVFEGVERVARDLKAEVLDGLCAGVKGREQALQEATKAVAKRKREVDEQLAKRTKAVDAAEQMLLKAVSQRFDALRGQLRAAAAEKSAALEQQARGLGEGAGSLKEARADAQRRLSSLGVEEKPVEVVEACLQLRKKLELVGPSSQASAPVREANLHAAMTSLKAVLGDIKKLGWCGALDVDPAKCALAEGDLLHVEPGGHFKVTLITQDKLGQKRKAGGLDVRATVESQAEVEGDVVVRDSRDGTYAISFKSPAVKGGKAEEVLFLKVEIGGVPISGSPFSVTLSPSAIVVQLVHLKALYGFLPGKRLELLYRASRDGWGAADFHRLCDNKGPALVVVREKMQGYIFGGYTKLGFSSLWAQHCDLEEFLFSLSNAANVPPVKLPSCTLSGWSTSCNNPSSGPNFGNHGELQLLSNGTPKYGSSYLGYAYPPPAGQAATFLTGSKSFQLSEVEVFRVT